MFRSLFPSTLLSEYTACLFSLTLLCSASDLGIELYGIAVLPFCRVHLVAVSYIRRRAHISDSFSSPPSRVTKFFCPLSFLKYIHTCAVWNGAVR